MFVAGPDVMVAAAMSTCVFSVEVLLSSLYVFLCSVVTVLFSASSMCLGGMRAVFGVSMAWFVECWDGGFSSVVVSVVVWFDVFWAVSFLGWLWLGMGSCCLG